MKRGSAGTLTRYKHSQRVTSLYQTPCSQPQGELQETISSGCIRYSLHGPNKMLPQPPDDRPGEKELTQKIHSTLNAGLSFSTLLTLWSLLHHTFRKVNTLPTLTARLANIHTHRASVHRVAALY